ncbi:hypothetical protein FRC11_006271, partial [Ceratobasidium sp. 423]
MSSYATDQVLSPPDLPPYLELIYKLNPVVGAPSDVEVIGLHSVVRAAQKAAEIPGMGDSVLLSRLSEHLFDVQMAKYRVKYLGTTFPENTTYAPPILPVHVAVKLEAVVGVPSEEDIIKVQEAIRAYQQFVNARHTQRAKQRHAAPVSHKTPSSVPTRATEQITSIVEDSSTTNNAGTGANAVASLTLGRGVQDAGLREAIERSNRLAEQANQLIERSNKLLERSNQIAERSNLSVEQSNQPTEWPNVLVEKFTEPLVQLNKHLDISNRLAQASTKPVEKIGDVLGNINKVLVAIQHAVVRNHKGNTLSALDCLVNEKGQTPVITESSWRTFKWLSEHFVGQSDYHLPVIIDGAVQDVYASNAW